LFKSNDEINGFIDVMIGSLSILNILLLISYFLLTTYQNLSEFLLNVISSVSPSIILWIKLGYSGIKVSPSTLLILYISLYFYNFKI
jgi:hypothetical protein